MTFCTLTKSLGAAALMLSLCSWAAWADPPRHDGFPQHSGSGFPARNMHYDVRYNHNHYYPRPGYAVPALPHGYYETRYRDSPYYFDRGVWYRPHGDRFVVTLAPIGLVVPVLPPFYSSLWVGGSQYYYADDTYYAWRPEERGYVVVDPPDDSQVTQPGSGGPNTSAGANEFFMYPKNGQSQQQQDKDRYECHRWASDQTGFDPTQAGGSVSESQAGQKRSDYGRAFSACLEARGYSVK
jgi:hypothetical protein